MATKGDSLAERVQQSYLQLSAVASDLNAVSDELGKHISEIDTALKKLNLGVEVWVSISSNGPDHTDPTFFNEDLGYAKISGRWGISLRTVSGYEGSGEESVEAWLFNDGPRSLRLSAIEKLPEMLKKLSEYATATTARIKGKLAEAKEVATAVKRAAEAPQPRIPIPVWGGGNK